MRTLLLFIPWILLFWLLRLCLFNVFVSGTIPADWLNGQRSYANLWWRSRSALTVYNIFFGEVSCEWWLSGAILSLSRLLWCLALTLNKHTLASLLFSCRDQEYPFYRGKNLSMQFQIKSLGLCCWFLRVRNASALGIPVISWSLCGIGASSTAFSSLKSLLSLGRTALKQEAGEVIYHAISFDCMVPS